MSVASRAWVSALLAGALACTSSGAPTASDPTASRTAPAASPTPTPTSSAVEGEPPHPVSIPALLEREFDGRNLRLRRELGRNDAYTRTLVTYRSGDLTVSGLMNVPRGTGPFPALVLLHGYIDPDVYTTGRGFERSQDYLARAGFVVLHVDYRNHATSDADPTNDLRLRLGYAEDAVNAVLALRRARLPYVDRDRIGMLGRSMGGGVALTALVLRPDIVGAAVLYAPVSSDAADNFNRWIRRPARAELARRIIQRYGSPKDEPVFWRNASARTFFDRIEVPILIHHGTADESVPYRWSEETLRALERNGVDARLRTYPGEGHAFGAAYFPSMARTVSFFERYL